MALHCRNCGSSNFHISRFRFRSTDLSQLLLLRLPVRCMSCDERAFASFSQFLKVRDERKARRRESRRAV
jgi:hypothetical protein